MQPRPLAGATAGQTQRDSVFAGLRVLLLSPPGRVSLPWLQAGGDGTVATRLLPSSPAQDVSSMKEQTRLLLLPAVQRRG